MARSSSMNSLISAANSGASAEDTHLDLSLSSSIPLKLNNCLKN